MKVELLSVWGTDLDIVNVARVSYGKKSESFSEKDERLIKYLIEHKHISCFRHPQIRFRIECGIFVERQLRKHEVGLEVANADLSNTSFNSISGRYVDFSDSYWTPTEFRKQSVDSKQGSSEERLSPELEAYYIEKAKLIIEKNREFYNELIEQGVSKEQARAFLPLALNTQFIWTGSLLAFLHLFDLRLKSDAQKETREVVQEMYRLLEEEGSFPVTLRHWKERK